MSELSSNGDFVFAHGWAMCNSFFDSLIERLKIEAPKYCSRNYFGTPVRVQWNGGSTKPWIGVGHSFGFARLTQQDLSNCRALFSICGFVDFCGERGTDPRVVRRMIRKLDRDPKNVVEDFLSRCGMDTNELPAVERWDLESLQTDLELMALPPDLETAPLSSIGGVPVFALAAEDDPIVPIALSRNQFARLFVSSGGGHRLGRAFADWCADKIVESYTALERNS